MRHISHRRIYICVGITVTHHRFIPRDARFRSLRQTGAPYSYSAARLALRSNGRGVLRGCVRLSVRGTVVAYLWRRDLYAGSMVLLTPSVSGLFKWRQFEPEVIHQPESNSNVPYHPFCACCIAEA